LEVTEPAVAAWFTGKGHKMKRVLIGALTVALATMTAFAQGAGDQNLQIHGFATQALVYTNNNNYLGMDTNSGSTAWTEAAVNVNDQVTSKLRAGVQFHYTRLGIFGGDNISVDWALGDYKVNRWVGVRAGKVKMRWGLYNDTQDYDPGYLWSLLPETIYGVDYRATDLSQLGAEVYGRVPLGEHLGKLSYSAWWGDYFVATNDGIMEDFNESGLNFTNTPWGKTPGFDLRWQTPVKGLMVGGSLMAYDAKGNLTNGTYFQPLAYWPAYYAKYDYKKLTLSGQYTKLIQYQTVTITGSAPSSSGIDNPAWFAMAEYHATDKLQVGAYYTRLWDAPLPNPVLPEDYFHEWVSSSRYDINSNFYAKLEGHYIDGTGSGYYGFNNPNGLKPRTGVLVGKVGFTF
jgi:hypothetical protein